MLWILRHAPSREHEGKCLHPFFTGTYMQKTHLPKVFITQNICSLHFINCDHPWRLAAPSTNYCSNDYVVFNKSDGIELTKFLLAKLTLETDFWCRMSTLTEDITSALSVTEKETELMSVTSAQGD